MEALLVNLFPAILAIPPQAIDGTFGSWLLQDNAHRVGEANGVVGSVWREKKHFALFDVNVAELAFVDGFEEHGAFVLIEPLGSLVYVVVCSGVGAAHYL